MKLEDKQVQGSCSLPQPKIEAGVGLERISIYYQRVAKSQRHRQASAQSPASPRKYLGSTDYVGKKSIVMETKGVGVVDATDWMTKRRRGD